MEPIHEAVMAGDLESVRSLIDDDASMLESKDLEGRSPIINSAVNGDLRLVHLLLELGAKPDARDKRGMSALHYAAQNYSIDIAKELLQHDATVDLADNYGNTPLRTATFNSMGRGEMISLLLANGANPYAANKYGSSPISEANEIANYDVKQFFSK